jgi:tetratricopeptide (TPR) repeat protein
MKLSPGQIIEIKKRILSYIKSRENKLAFKLFHKHFSEENPPDPQFIINMYTELNKLDQMELSFRIVEETAAWLPQEPEIQDLRRTALKIYFDSLLVSGNRLLTEREEKASKFHESLKKVDSLSREKIESENEKILLGIVKKALSCYKKAYSINPDSIGAITGLYRCSKILKDEESISRYETILEEKNPLLFSEPSEKKKHDDAVVDEFDIEEFNVREVSELYDKGQYNEVIKRVDFLHLTHKIHVPLLLLKAESLVALKRFKHADKVLYEAEKENNHLKELRELKNSIYETKYALLSKAGEIYLKKALELGPSLGMNHFKKARICLKKALAIFPENIDLLDQQYTVLKYLKEDEEAYKAKAMIYLLNNKFVPSFDRENSNSLCFIATYAYEGQKQNIEVFRWFRREFLLPSNLGRFLNCIYVRFSPGVVKFARNHSLPPYLFKLLLFPLLFMVKSVKSLFKN